MGLSCSRIFSCGMWDLEFPEQGSNLGLLHWECGILATGPPGKSPRVQIDINPIENNLAAPDENGTCISYKPTISYKPAIPS